MCVYYMQVWFRMQIKYKLTGVSLSDEQPQDKLKESSSFASEKYQGSAEDCAIWIFMQSD